jgi:uncharacterized tellurite resistance protein B-like protein
VITIALDRDKHKVEPERQREIRARLKKIGLSASSLQSLLNRLQAASHEAVYEYVALQRLLLWRKRRGELEGGARRIAEQGWQSRSSKAARRPIRAPDS